MLLLPGHWVRKYWSKDFWQQKYWPGFPQRSHLLEEDLIKPVELLKAEYVSNVELNFSVTGRTGFQSVYDLYAFNVLSDYSFVSVTWSSEELLLIDEDLWICES